MHAPQAWLHSIGAWWKRWGYGAAVLSDFEGSPQYLVFVLKILSLH